MTPDGNSDSQERKKNTGIGKDVHKYERIYLLIYFLFILLISLAPIQIFTATIIHFIVGFITYINVRYMTKVAQKGGK